MIFEAFLSIDQTKFPPTSSLDQRWKFSVIFFARFFSFFFLFLSVGNEIFPRNKLVLKKITKISQFSPYFSIYTMRFPLILILPSASG